MSLDFWRDRRVLVTGHTGFKGAWATRWLVQLGAKVGGIALAASSTPNLFDLLKPWNLLANTVLNIEDASAVTGVIREFNPEFVLHMAAQSLVPRSYRDPVETWRTNVMGTVHVLEALRHCSATRVILVVTSDKVYRNDDALTAFHENDGLGGDDPYSASKAACEFVVNCWRHSFFDENVKIASARAGNIIGGGDWAEQRLVPDLVRSITEQREMLVRNPHATRPWQHVLDPLFGYFLYMERLATSKAVPSALNFGPAMNNPFRVSEIIERLAKRMAVPTKFRHAPEAKILEKQHLQLNPSLALQSLGWRTRLDVEATIDWTCEWYAAWRDGQSAALITDQQIKRYTKLLAGS